MNILLKFGNFFVVSIAVALFFLPLTVFAQPGVMFEDDSVPPGGQNQQTAPPGGQNQGVPPGGQNQGTQTFVQNPLNVDSFCGLLKALFNVAIQVGVPIAVVFVVYAGFKFVFARGNPEGLKRAKVNLAWTLGGIALFFGAWFLAEVITNTLVELGGSEFNTCV